MRPKPILLLCFLFLFVYCNEPIEQLGDPDAMETLSGATLTTDAGQFLCLTPQNIPNQDFEQILRNTPRLQSTPDVYCINVAFHIVRRSNGTGGFNASQIDNIIQDLNDAYNEHGLFFYNDGVDFISNSVYFDLLVGGANDELADLFAINNSPDAINFYLVNGITDAGSGQGVGGIAEDIPSTNLVIENSLALTQVSSHEVGHCLNLYHTHRGSTACEPSACAENINGSNCSTCGDYVCDTPADPCLSNQVNAQCQYTGGGGYTPMVENIMSYAPPSCLTSFTNGQANRVHAALAVSSVLEPVIRTNCTVPDISGPDLLCNSSVYTLNNLPSGATVVWSASPTGRVTFSNQTATTVTVQNVYSQHGTAVLRAEVSVGGNSISVFKTITLPADAPHIALNPPAATCLLMNSNRTFQAGYTTTGSFQHIDTHQSVTEVEWEIHDYSTSPPSQITNYQTYNTTVLRSSISLNLHSNPSDYVIEIVSRAKSICGTWGPWGPGHAYFVRRNCSSPFTVFDITYDKSTQHYNLMFSAEYNKLREILSTNPERKTRMTDSYELSVYDQNDNRVYSDRKSSNITSSLSGLLVGDYRIVLLQDGNIYEQVFKVEMSN